MRELRLASFEMDRALRQIRIHENNVQQLVNEVSRWNEYPVWMHAAQRRLARERYDYGDAVEELQDARYYFNDQARQLNNYSRYYTMVRRADVTLFWRLAHRRPELLFFVAPLPNLPLCRFIPLRREFHSRFGINLHRNRLYLIHFNAGMPIARPATAQEATEHRFLRH